MSSNHSHHDKNAEAVLVVPREKLFPDGVFDGLRKESLGGVLSRIVSQAQFLPRGQVEQDPSFKQIIPYLVFHYQGKLFLMQRTEGHTDQRLASLYSLGIGGHLRQEEFVGHDILAWAKREFEEEVDYHGHLRIEPLGLLNDESNGVGSVHTGLVLLLEGDTSEIEVRDEHQSGRLATLAECEAVFGQMESWSKIVLEALRKEALWQRH